MKKNIYQMCTKMGDAYFQCVNNHYAKFEYKVMNTVGVTDYTNKAGWKKMSKFSTRQKNKLWNVHKINGAHIQGVNNHFQSLNIKERKLL